MGPTAALVECAPGEAGGLAAAASAHGVVAGRDGVLELVPAARTVLVDCVDIATLDRVLAVLSALDVDTLTGSPRQVELPVRFDGADLDQIAERSAVEPGEVVAALLERPLRVAFCGFSPGFAYLDGLPDWLHLPRRPQPRARVPEGSFAIAAGYAAVYPATSPGGWHLLGTTTVEVWSAEREPPALLAPGDQVRIVEVRS